MNVGLNWDWMHAGCTTGRGVGAMMGSRMVSRQGWTMMRLGRLQGRVQGQMQVRFQGQLHGQLQVLFQGRSQVLFQGGSQGRLQGRGWGRNVSLCRADSSGEGFAEVSRTLGERLGALGVTKATEIQRETMRWIERGEDTAVQSYTGSGKTLAYLVPLLERFVVNPEGYPEEKGAYGTVRCVVVVPSHELAMQIVREAGRLLEGGKWGKKPGHAAVQQLIGGVNVLRQIENLRKNRPAIVVGTPGRLEDLSKKGELQTHGAACLVLDEFDGLLRLRNRDPRTREQLQRMTDHVGRRHPGGRQTVFVSATFLGKTLKEARGLQESGKEGGEAKPLRYVRVSGSGKVMSALLTDVESVEAAAAEAASPGASASDSQSTGEDGPDPGLADLVPPTLWHAYVVTRKRHRVDALRRSLYAFGAAGTDMQKVGSAKCGWAAAARAAAETEEERAAVGRKVPKGGGPLGGGLVFVAETAQLEQVAGRLETRGLATGMLGGDSVSQGRAGAIRDFNLLKTPCLVSTEVAARGIDLPSVAAVFNLDIPRDAVAYVHRAGRAGRAGKPGAVVTFIEEEQIPSIERIGRKLGVKMHEVHITGGQVSLVTDPATQRIDSSYQASRPSSPGAKTASTQRES